MYFTNFKKNIKTLNIRINPVKELAIRMFFYFCLSFFVLFEFCQYDLFRQFLQQIYAQKNTCQFLLFHFPRFCVVALFFKQKMLLIGIFLLIFLFFLVIIWLNPKSDLDLIVLFDNLVCIIIGITITSLTYIDCLLPLINLALSVLFFLICCFVSSFIF